MSDELVTISCENGIADVRLNRADKHNSLTIGMFDAIAAAGAALADDSTLRVVVLSGHGASFCAGLDFSLMRALLSENDAAQGDAARLLEPSEAPENLAQRVALIWKTLPVPVIAAISGVAFGGGFQIAMGCDIRIASPDARFSIMEMRYGLIPDMSITATLPEHVARDVALELTLTAREFAAAEALSLGLVTRVNEHPYQRAMELAAQIAARSPHAVRACKRLYNESWRNDVAAGLALEAGLQATLVGSKNQREAVAAALEKRAPEFIDVA